MSEKRLSTRVESTIQLKGKLYHVVDFKVRNISMGGINILSTFQPRVGSAYTIFLMDNGITQDFDVQILRCEMEDLQAENNKSEMENVDTTLSVGAKFLHLNGERLRFLESFLKRSGYSKEVGFISGDEPESKKSKGKK